MSETHATHRRVLLLVSAGGMAVFGGFLTVALYGTSTAWNDVRPRLLAHWLLTSCQLAVMSILIYVTFFEFGLVSIYSIHSKVRITLHDHFPCEA